MTEVDPDMECPAQQTFRTKRGFCQAAAAESSRRHSWSVLRAVRLPMVLISLMPLLLALACMEEEIGTSSSPIFGKRYDVWCVTVFGIPATCWDDPTGGTPTGTYTLTGTAGNTTHSTSLTLVVQ